MEVSKIVVGAICKRKGPGFGFHGPHTCRIIKVRRRGVLTDTVDYVVLDGDLKNKEFMSNIFFFRDHYDLVSSPKPIVEKSTPKLREGY